MRARTRVVVLVALAAAGIPLSRVAWFPSPSRSAADAAAGPAAAPPPAGPAAAPPPAAPAAATAALAQPGAVSAPPLPPRAAYLRASRTRAVPRPVKAGEAPPEKVPQVAALAPAPPPSRWADVAIVNPWGVGSPSPAVTREIQATLHPRLAECFERGAQAAWAGLGRSYSTVAPPGEPGRGPAILVLEVEDDGSGVKVVDAPVEARGSVGDGTLNCAQSVLRGAKLKARAEGNARFRMRYALRR